MIACKFMSGEAALEKAPISTLGAFQLARYARQRPLQHHRLRDLTADGEQHRQQRGKAAGHDHRHSLAVA